jgi:hypothetical protein
MIARGSFNCRYVRTVGDNYPGSIASHFNTSGS